MEEKNPPSQYITLTVITFALRKETVFLTGHVALYIIYLHRVSKGRPALSYASPLDIAFYKEEGIKYYELSYNKNAIGED